MLFQKPPNPVPYIVVADDNSSECTRFQELLNDKKVPYIFSSVSNGEMLFKMLDEHDVVPDIIFIDHIPGISGKDCMEALKARKRLNKVPIVVYSDAEDPKDKDYCYNIKPSEYFLTALEYLI